MSVTLLAIFLLGDSMLVIEPSSGPLQCLPQMSDNIPLLHEILLYSSSPLYSLPSSELDILLHQHGIPAHSINIQFSLMAFICLSYK